EWWEASTGLPLPLGGIAVSRSLPLETQRAVEQAVHRSVSRARLNPEESKQYVADNAQEMDPAVCRAHIDLYVNDYTLDFGQEGTEAIQQLLSSAARVGVVPDSERGLFWDDNQA
ncbi:MAG: 1,4-dihydroxy-6-naphthoate synthase, partial [Actinobacteria bacterium]|nr:1,4-dihydroxy-6-naphthoate synthase [Actinomycetota bacterium]